MLPHKNLKIYVGMQMASLLVKCLMEDPKFLTELVSIAEVHPSVALCILKLLEKMANMDEGRVNHREFLKLVKSKMKKLGER